MFGGTRERSFGRERIVTIKEPTNVYMIGFLAMLPFSQTFHNILYITPSLYNINDSKWNLRRFRNEFDGENSRSYSSFWKKEIRNEDLRNWSCRLENPYFNIPGIGQPHSKFSTNPFHQGSISILAKNPSKSHANIEFLVACLGASQIIKQKHV